MAVSGHGMLEISPKTDEGRNNMTSKLNSVMPIDTSVTRLLLLASTVRTSYGSQVDLLAQFKTSGLRQNEDHLMHDSFIKLIVVSGLGDGLHVTI